MSYIRRSWRRQKRRSSVPSELLSKQYGRRQRNWSRLHWKRQERRPRMNKKESSRSWRNNMPKLYLWVHHYVVVVDLNWLLTVLLSKVRVVLYIGFIRKMHNICNGCLWSSIASNISNCWLGFKTINSQMEMTFDKFQVIRNWILNNKYHVICILSQGLSNHVFSFYLSHLLSIWQL